MNKYYQSLLCGLVVLTLGVSANATSTPYQAATNISPDATGFVNVYRDFTNKTMLYVDLDSISRSNRQVLGGLDNDQYLRSVVKIYIAPNTPLKVQEGLSYVLQDWSVSCSDYSYKKLVSNSYDKDGVLLESLRTADDFLKKSDFIPASDANNLTMGTTLAAKVVCDYYNANNKKKWWQR